MDKDKLCEEAMKKDYQSILRYCLQLLGQDMHSADDCTQEVFLLFWKKRRELNFNDNIRGWLYAAADRICRDYRRKEVKRLSSIEADPEKASLQAVQMQLPDDASAFDSLSEDEYRMLEAYYAESYGERKELAKSMGLTTVQLTRRVHSIREKLRKYMKKKE